MTIDAAEDGIITGYCMAIVTGVPFTLMR